jgi:nucleotide-binding universal stress UspA family protein
MEISSETMTAKQTSTVGASANYKKILVGYDGSTNSERALIRAVSIANQLGAALTVVVVVNTGPIALAPMEPPIPEEVFDDLQKNGKDVLTQGMNIAGEDVPQVTGTVEEGNPADRLLDVASKHGADLIVLGKRGHSGIERFLIGGVSSNVISHAHCDVLVVK